VHIRQKGSRIMNTVSASLYSRFRRIGLFMVIALFLGSIGLFNRSMAADTPLTLEKDGESDVYIVLLDDVPLASYRGGVGNIPATSPAVTGERRINTRSAATVAYRRHLAQRRAGMLQAATQALGRPLAPSFEYDGVVHGFAATMTPAEAGQLVSLPGVASVERERIYELHTDAGPAWIGAEGVWDGTDTGGLPATKGEGVIVGVIDTGVDPWNPSFADVGDDGYDHTNPLGAGNYLGVCDPNNTTPEDGIVDYDSSFPCNDKLIGVWGYEASDTSPRDTNGHGAHTASTAAGNVVNNALIAAPTFSTTLGISGVAPHANIIVYDGCTDTSGCPGSSLLAGLNQAFLDGVDVVNYSIGGTSIVDPWTDSKALATLALRDAGILFVTSAGNNGPNAATVGTPAYFPWVTSVAAASHDRALVNTLALSDAESTEIEGLSVTGGYGPAEIVLAADYAGGDISADDARLCADGVFPAGTFNGEIVVCERGSYGRITKGQTVMNGGGGGYILAQPTEDGGGFGALAADPHVLPAIHIDYDGYQTLLTALNTSTGPLSGTIQGTVVQTDPSYGDVLASFSSRGPSFVSSLIDTLMPKVTAPGRDIAAAYHQGPGGDGDHTFNFNSGTSMSSPHVAGAGALLTVLHPEWSPAEIESALMTTAITTTLDDDGINVATPFGQGAGRIDVGRAARVGFVMDVTTQEYQDANPATGGDLKELNTPSLVDSDCVFNCSWTRTLSGTTSTDWTVTATTPAGLNLNISPNSFSLAEGATRSISITANVTGLPLGEWVFAEVVLTPDDSGVPVAHFPVAVMPVPMDAPEFVSIQTDDTSGTHTVEGIRAIEITDLQSTASLVEADTATGDFAPSLGFTSGFVTTEVQAGDLLLATEIISSTAPNIDLYVGLDSNENSLPDNEELLCTSTGVSWDELCYLFEPAAGTYWLYIELREGSGEAFDYAGLAYASVPDTATSNISVSGPTSMAGGTPFDLDMSWDEPTMERGSIWYGATTLGTDASNPDNVGIVGVGIRRNLSTVYLPLVHR
jgi:subtilisin family serine protease